MKRANACCSSIRLAPSYAAYTNLGNLDLKQDRFADAADDYEKALEFNKTDYRVWSNLAVAYSRTPGQQDKAKDAFLHAAQMCREALNENRNDPAELSDLAMFVASEGDERQEPLMLIERALALALEDTYVQFNAAETYEEDAYLFACSRWISPQKRSCREQSIFSMSDKSPMHSSKSETRPEQRNPPSLPYYRLLGSNAIRRTETSVLPTNRPRTLILRPRLQIVLSTTFLSPRCATAPSPVNGHSCASL